MTAPRIFLLVGLLGAGTAVETAYQVREHIGVGAFGWRLLGGKFNGPHHVFEEKALRAIEAGTLVAVENAFGDVEVKAGGAEPVEVVLRKDVYIGDVEKAQAFAERIRLQADLVGGRLQLRTNREELERERDAFDVGFETHFEVRVPAGTPVEVKGSHGQAAVEGAGETTIDNSHGDVRVLRVTGARVESRHGGVELETVSGAVLADVRHGDISVRDAAGPVRVTSEGGGVNAQRVGALEVQLKNGDLQADTIAGGLQVRGEHAGVEAKAVAGGADVETSYADTTLEDVAADARVKVERGAVVLTRVKGSVTAQSNFGDVRLEDVAGRAEVTVGHGGVRAKRVLGGFVARTDGDDIVLDGFKGQVEAEARRGSVRLTPEGPVAAGIKASASFGNVRLQVPEGSRFDLVAQVEGGELRVTLPGLELSEQDEARLAGRLGEGGPQVLLQAEHGDVRVSNRIAKQADSGDDE